MIRLNVFIRTTESNREELIATARELVAASLKDEGCVAYDLFESSTRRDVLMKADLYRKRAMAQYKVSKQNLAKVNEDYEAARKYVADPEEYDFYKILNWDRPEEL